MCASECMENQIQTMWWEKMKKRKQQKEEYDRKKHRITENNSGYKWF